MASHRLHKTWLKVMAVVVGSFGPVFALGSMAATAEPARLTLDLLSWPLDGATLQPRGGTTKGAPITLDTAPSKAWAALQAADIPVFERDRRAILAMAGTYRVTFDFLEVVPYAKQEKPHAPYQSWGTEKVYVDADDGKFISLVHILEMRIVQRDGTISEPMVTKHWRQDWVYQPETVLTYAGPNHWALTQVPADQRAGAWSQTVWQTDDSPRYGGVGRWTYDNGMKVWTSEPTWRPLARRDAVLNPVYDRYLGTNRHALTPNGWVHIQDNMKMGPAQGDEGEPVAIVQEDVVNTYRKVDNYDPKPGDDYWAATKAYWAGVRAAWDERINA